MQAHVFTGALSSRHPFGSLAPNGRAAPSWFCLIFLLQATAASALPAGLSVNLYSIAGASEFCLAFAVSWLRELRTWKRLLFSGQFLRLGVWFIILDTAGHTSFASSFFFMEQSANVGFTSDAELGGSTPQSGARGFRKRWQSTISSLANPPAAACVSEVSVHGSTGFPDDVLKASSEAGLQAAAFVHPQLYTIPTTMSQPTTVLCLSRRLRKLLLAARPLLWVGGWRLPRKLPQGFVQGLLGLFGLSQGFLHVSGLQMCFLIRPRLDLCMGVSFCVQG